jgi:hypothetical protein
LRNLPREARRYFFGPAEEMAAVPPALEMLAPLPAAVEAEARGEFQEPMLVDSGRPESKEVSLCEALDRILHKGAVIHGEVMISVAGIDLVYLGLQVVLASMETARGFKLPGVGQLGPNLFDKGASR